MEILLCIMSFAAGGAAVFIGLIIWFNRRAANPPPLTHEKQYLNFLSYDGTERGQQRVDG